MSDNELTGTKDRDHSVHVRKEDVIEVLKALEAFKRKLLSLIQK